MKERINISIDSEIAKAMRTEAIERYGSLRAFSQLIEDIYTHKNQVDDSGLSPLTHEELVIVNKEPDLTYSSSLKTQNQDCSCHGIWDKFYKCPDCGLVFETYGSNRPSIFCPQCDGKRVTVKL